MKKLILILLALTSVPVLTAQTGEFSEVKKSAVVDNLTVGIESGNAGLGESSANVLYDLIEQSYLKSSDASKAMIPLLKLLENGKTENERIAAAVALYQLGNAIGIYRLRGVAIFDDNPRVKSVCKNLYYTYHKLNGTEYFLDF